MVELGQVGQVNPLLLRAYGYERYLSLVPKGLEDELKEAIRNGHPEPYGKNCNLVYIEMNYPLDQILLSNEIRRSWEAGDRKSVLEQIQAILNRAVKRTNERMIGYVPPETMKFRRIVAGIVVTAIIVIFLFVVRYIFRAFTRSMCMLMFCAAGR
jgi:hypothetical protein